MKKRNFNLINKPFWWIGTFIGIIIGSVTGYLFIFTDNSLEETIILTVSVLIGAGIGLSIIWIINKKIQNRK